MELLCDGVLVKGKGGGLLVAHAPVVAATRRTAAASPWTSSATLLLATPMLAGAGEEGASAYDTAKCSWAVWKWGSQRPSLFEITKQMLAAVERKGVAGVTASA
ncbi:hypothetical protein T492DRAFT_836846 [Pavlovales sp. CCMP2436]|nr:hypothetical protein T492DRAFT_836846 [Pavlovales sp. CCMP2436]